MKAVSFRRSKRQTFLTIFAILVIVLMFLPFFASLNDLLTNLVIRSKLYSYIEEYVVPLEVRLVGALLMPFGFKLAIVDHYLAVTEPRPFFLEIIWNCVGWQSLVFLLITFMAGLSGNFSLFSKGKVILIGFIGTFWVNLLRIAVVFLLAFYLGQTPAIIFHDYGSTLILIGWLFFFWWFSYRFVLEERQSFGEKETIKV